MNCAARAAIALMDKSQARQLARSYSFCCCFYRCVRIEAERENFWLFGIISISLRMYAGLRCISAGRRVKNPFSPPDIIYTQTHARSLRCRPQAPRAHTPVLRGFETRAWQKKNFGSERERERGGKEAARKTDRHFSQPENSLAPLSLLRFLLFIFLTCFSGS